MEQERIKKSIFIYIVLTYLISGVGYVLWYVVSEEPGKSPFAIIPIAAPILSAFTIYFMWNRKISLMIKNVSLTGILMGALLPVIYIGIALLVYRILGRPFGVVKLTAKQIIGTFALWTFSGFCEEVGWRGVLLPFLKKIMKLNSACLVNGIIWTGWHIPIILAGEMVTKHTLIVGIMLFMVEAICISYIMGMISESRWGNSIWTYVSLHAMQNIMIKLVLKIYPHQERYLDDGGYIIVGVLVIFTFIMWIILRRKTKVKDMVME